MSMSFDEWYDKGRLTLASIQNPQIYSEDNSNKENMRHAWYSGIAHIISDIISSGELFVFFEIRADLTA